MCADDRVHLDPMVLVSVCKPCYHIIVIMQNYLKVLNFIKACQVPPVSSVCLRLSQLSWLSSCNTLCVVSLPLSLMMIARIHVFYLIIKPEVRPISHRLSFGQVTMVCAVCLFIFLYHITLHCVVLKPIISLHIISCILLYRITSHHITSQHLTSYYILPYRIIISYHIISYHIISHHITSHHIKRLIN